MAGVVAGLALTSGQAVLIDDFNNYVNTSYIQPGQNPAWSRFGAGTTDGISSIAGGVDGTRGAAYSVNFGLGTGSVKYTFSTLQNFTSTTVLTLDLEIPLSLTGTQVQAVIYDGGSSQTIYQTTVQSLTNATYITYTFDFTAANVSRAQGSASLADVLANVSAIGFRFSNTNGAGSATINFDNLNVVPEPTTTAALGLAGVIVGLYRLRCRQRGQNAANIR